MESSPGTQSFSQAFVFICQDMYSDTRRQAIKELSPSSILNQSGGFFFGGGGLVDYSAFFLAEVFSH